MVRFTIVSRIIYKSYRRYRHLCLPTHRIAGHLKELFGIEKMPFYIVMGKHNVLLLKRLEISLLIQDELDSLINEQNKALL